MGAANNIVSIIDQLQGPNGIIDNLNILIKKFDEKKIVDYSINELDKYLAKFQENYSIISSYYESFIAAYIDTNNENEKQTIKLFLDYCLLFLNRIQNKYSNPILYRINQINNQNSIKKANISITWGKISVFIGVIATAISVYFSVKPNDKIILISNEIQEQTLKLNNLQKEFTSIDSLLRFDNMIPPKINKDSLVKKIQHNP